MGFGGDIKTAQYAMSLIAVVLFTSTAAFGMSAMSKLGTICIPVIGIFGVVSAVIGVRNLGGMSDLMAYEPSTTLSFGSMVGLAIGSWIGCACSLLPDFMRFAKNTKVAAGLGIQTISGAPKGLAQIPPA